MEINYLKKNILDKKYGRRSFLIGTSQLILVGLLIRQIRQIQLNESEKYKLLAEENRIDIEILPPLRGVIFDKDGKILAKNKENYRIKIFRDKNINLPNVMENLSKLIKIRDERKIEIIKELEKRRSNSSIIIVENLSWIEFKQVLVNLPSLPGIIPEVDLKRFYTQKDLLAHLLGYVGVISPKDLKRFSNDDPILQIQDFKIGKVGIEKGLDSYLRGKVGLSKFEVNASGKIVRKLAEEPSSTGKDIHLTIDTNLQKFTMLRIKEYSASAVVIDLSNGGIISMASNPSYDPNKFIEGISKKDWDMLLQSKNQPLANKAISGNYPPGSTFKMIVAIAALEENLINPEDLFECNGFYELEERKFHCWKYSGHGSTNLLKGIEESCDVYFYNLAERVGIDRIVKTAKKFGIGITPNLPLSGISKGLIPSKSWKKINKNQLWFTGDTLNSGIGQGFMLSTPIQIAIMTARIATGLEIKPSLIKAIDGKPTKYNNYKLLGIKKSTLEIIRQAMFGVVNNKKGTAFNSRLINENKIFAGKTGTSQIRQISEEERSKGIIKNEDLPRNQRDHALFTGYAPFTNPKFSVSIVVEHGGGGGKVAAPIARDILLYALNGALPSLQEYPAEERNNMNSIIKNIKREMLSIL
tara:strand:+ start:501 stop:2423 length:1923 start_codon:yes stop_codon:yes gene_type:complete